MAGEENPADLASRGVCPSELNSCTLWWNGPHWLSKPEEYWPRQPPPQCVEDLPKLKFVGVTTIEPQLEKGKVSLLKAYGSYLRLKE